MRMASCGEEDAGHPGIAGPDTAGIDTI
jgi:hypothetical protein